MDPSTVVQSFRKLRIAVIGDVMLDHYVWGDTRRISPEAPVPVVDVHRDSYTAGGAANVALNLAALGVQVELCGVTGQDEAAERLRDLLAHTSVCLDPAFSRPEFRTTVKTRVIVQHQQLCRLDRELSPHHHRLDAEDKLNLCLDKVREADAIILSDYAKGVITQPLLDEIRGEAAKRNTFIALDPKPKRHLEFSGVDVITPNRAEAFELAGISEPSFDEDFPAAEVAGKIFQKHRPRSLVITLGANGMLICRSAANRTHLPTRAREVFDVSGAGDTIAAVLTASIAAGLSLEEAGHVSNVAAGIVVGKVGTAVVTPEDLESRLKEVEVMRAEQAQKTNE